MEKDQARQIASSTVLEALEEINLDFILNQYSEAERTLLEDAFDHLREEIRQFAASGRQSDDEALTITDEEMTRYDAIRREQFAKPEPVADGEEDF